MKNKNKRIITLLAVSEIEREEQVFQDIEKYCQINSLNYKRVKKETKENGYYLYFTITGNTADYVNLMKQSFKQHIQTIGLAKIGNMEDCDQKSLDDVEQLVDLFRKQLYYLKATNNKLSMVLKKTKNRNTLFEIRKYCGYLTKHQLNLIDTSIHIRETGNIEDVHEATSESIASLYTNVETLRSASNMTRRRFCSYFKIPYRTVEDWEKGRSNCSTYLFELMKQKLIDNRILDIYKYNELIRNLL